VHGTALEPIVRAVLFLTKPTLLFGFCGTCTQNLCLTPFAAPRQQFLARSLDRRLPRFRERIEPRLFPNRDLGIGNANQPGIPLYRGLSEETVQCVATRGDPELPGAVTGRFVAS
jgi:hypothetical protein